VRTSLGVSESPRKRDRRTRRRCDDRRQSAGVALVVDVSDDEDGVDADEKEGERCMSAVYESARESLGEEKNTYKEDEIRVRPGAPGLARSLARPFVRSRIIYTGGERERASGRARVHYDSCIYIRSKNIRARCVPAGPARYFI